MSRWKTAGSVAVVVLMVAVCASVALAQRGARGGAVIQASTVAKTEKEEQILAVLKDWGKTPTTQRLSNVPREDGRLLRVLAEAINAKHVVEIGTSNGYSTLWLSGALVNTGGKLTFELTHERVLMAGENFKRAGVDDIITIVEGDAHEEVTKLKEPIDLLFLDADKKGYVDYLQKLLPLVRPGGLVVAHNMTPSMADARYVEAITKNPDLETVFVSQPGNGMAITLKKR